MLKDRKLFLASDVDGTLLNTLDKRPGFVNVDEACLRAVEQSFGSPALKVYEAIGFLQNREPRELVSILSKTADILGVPVRDHGSIRSATDAFVKYKLSHMLPQISRDWPIPYKGVVEFLGKSQRGELPVEVGIISSGHDQFVIEAFKVNGLQPPQFMVTSDAVRHLNQPKVPKFKPFTYQMAVLHRKIEGTIKDPISEDRNTFLARPQFKRKVAYVGDDPKKDIGLARRSRMVGILVPNVYPNYVPETGAVRITDFAELSYILEGNKDAILKGAGWSDILLRVDYGQIFREVAAEDRPYNKWLRDPLDPSVKGLFP